MAAGTGGHVALGRMRVSLGCARGTGPPIGVERQRTTDPELPPFTLPEADPLVASQAEGLGSMAGLAILGARPSIERVGRDVVARMKS